jgi:hypothetical protein
VGYGGQIVDIDNKIIQNKISVKVSPEIRNKLMTDGLKLFYY